MKITEITNFDDFLELKDDWNQLLSLTNNDVFSTWEWLSIWWKYYGASKKLMILLAHEDNEIIGIAPLMFSPKKFFGVKKGIIEFIGAKDLHSGYNDFIIVRNHNKCIKEFIKHLNCHSFNWVYSRLIDIPDTSPNLQNLTPFSVKTDIAHECLSVPLPHSFDLFLKQIQKRARKSFKTKYNRLINEFEVNFVDYSALNLVSYGMDSVFDLHQRRWKVKGGFEGMFANPRFKDFSLDIANSFSKKEWLGLYGIEISGNPIAVSYGFIYKNKYYSNISGINSNFLDYDIGILLRFLIMEKCINKKIFEYDFLWGNDIWKRRFRPFSKKTYNSIIIRNNFSSKLTTFLNSKYENGKIILNRKFKKKTS
jgi:CelD/BcsL family acetyltransferase involved in cellulose biosynthesis